MKKYKKKLFEIIIIVVLIVVIIAVGTSSKLNLSPKNNMKEHSGLFEGDNCHDPKLTNTWVCEDQEICDCTNNSPEPFYSYPNENGNCPYAEPDCKLITLNEDSDLCTISSLFSHQPPAGDDYPRLCGSGCKNAGVTIDEREYEYKNGNLCCRVTEIRLCVPEDSIDSNVEREVEAYRSV